MRCRDGYVPLREGPQRMEAQAIAVEKPFVAAEAKFTELVTRLGTEESRRMTHSELESLITAEGREIQRRLLQGHLDLRASEEQGQASVRRAVAAVAQD